MVEQPNPNLTRDPRILPEHPPAHAPASASEANAQTDVRPATQTDAQVAREKLERSEIVISRLLSYGVWLSLVVIGIGSVVCFITNPGYRNGTSIGPLTIHTAFPHNFTLVFESLFHLRGEGIVMLGILMLIGTPLLRVFVSLIMFWRERDTIYTIITATVLGLLMIALALGRVE